MTMFATAAEALEVKIGHEIKRGKDTWRVTSAPYFDKYADGIMCGAVRLIRSKGTYSSNAYLFRLTERGVK